MTLTFVEPSAAAGERVFDVSANGRTALAGIDVAREARCTLAAIQRRFDVDVSGGTLNLVLRASKSDAMLSAIEVVPRYP